MAVTGLIHVNGNCIISINLTYNVFCCYNSLNIYKSMENIDWTYNLYDLSIILIIQSKLNDKILNQSWVVVNFDKTPKLLKP
jgi:hypothetical protein